MNLDFSDDQKFLQSEARKFLEKEDSIKRSRDVLDKSGSVDRDLWEKIVALGWTGVRIPDQFDGLGLGHLELCVIAEELGFMGVLSILMVLGTLVFRALLIGQNALKNGKEYEGYLALAIGIWFAFQTMVNVGASAGILPTKGLTLPFISYGCSSLLMMTIATGILLRVDFETKMATKQATSGGAKR